MSGRPLRERAKRLTADTYAHERETAAADCFSNTGTRRLLYYPRESAYLHSIVENISIAGPWYISIYERKTACVALGGFTTAADNGGTDTSDGHQKQVAEPKHHHHEHNQVVRRSGLNRTQANLNRTVAYHCKKKQQGVKQPVLEERLALNDMSSASQRKRSRDAVGSANEIKKETLCCLHHTGLLCEAVRCTHSLGGPLAVLCRHSMHVPLHRQRRLPRPFDRIDDHLELLKRPLVENHWRRNCRGRTHTRRSCRQRRDRVASAVALLRLLQLHNLRLHGRKLCGQRMDVLR